MFARRPRGVRTFALGLMSLLTSGCYVTVPFDGLATGTPAPSLGVERWLNNPGGAAIEVGPREVPTLLEFWSRKCPPCVRCVPVIRAIQEAYGDSLNVITVHVQLPRGAEPDLEAIQAFVEEQGVSYPVGIDTGGAPWERYDFGALPHGVIIDRDGKVLWSGNLVVWDIQKALEKHVGKPARALDPSALLPKSSGDPAHDCKNGACTIES